VYPAQQLLAPRTTIQTGGFWQGLLSGLTFGASDLLFEPAPSAGETLQERAEASIAGGVCDPASANYDAVACEHVKNPDILHPQTDQEIADQIASLHCDTFDMLCHYGLRKRDGTWLSPVEWPMPMKIVGGVVVIAGVAASVSLVRSLASAFKGSE